MTNSPHFSIPQILSPIHPSPTFYCHAAEKIQRIAACQREEVQLKSVLVDGRFALCVCILKYRP